MKTSIPFLTQPPDPRNPDRIKQTFDTFWKIIFTALITGCGNILEISAWIHDIQQILFDFCLLSLMLVTIYFDQKINTV